jgi:polyisoprenoid-binding protein YceI
VQYEEGVYHFQRLLKGAYRAFLAEPGTKEALARGTTSTVIWELHDRSARATALVGPLPSPSPPLPTLPAPTWTIDVAHSEVNFRIRHFMSRVSGTFTDWSGTIQGDPANWSGGSVTATINVASVDTRQERRDTDLRSGRFFAVDSFPTITFVSRTVVQAGDSLTISGDLTMRGQGPSS